MPIEPKDFRLDNKIALVAGGSRGIGKAISLAYSAQGAEVIVASRKRDACQVLADEIANAGGKAHAMACNSGDLEQVRALIDQVEAKFGRLDILVNNSAANPWFGPLLELEVEAYDKTVDVNLRGTLFTSIFAARVMAKHGGGVIINTGSINAEQPVIGQGIYSITKGAVTTMTKALAKELASKSIRVNAILPGITKTDALKDLFQGSDELPDRLKKEVPMRRHAMPDEMAGAAVYLASDASSYTTGACLTIDGGRTL